MNDQTLDIDSSVIGTLAFILMKICRRVQSFIATPFWVVAVKPALVLAKLVGRRNPKSDEGTDKKIVLITLDELKRGHRIILRYLKRMLKISSLLNGVVSGTETYSRLLTWSKRIPVIAFQKEETAYTIQILQQKHPDGARTFDLMWICMHDKEANFRIISKEIQDQRRDQVLIKGLWISGKDQGKIFEIGSLFPFDAQMKGADHPLTAIYFPPRFIIVLMEVIGSAGAILAFFQLTQGGWVLLKGLLAIPSRMVVEGWVSLRDLFF